MSNPKAYRYKAAKFDHDIHVDRYTGVGCTISINNPLAMYGHGFHADIDMAPDEMRRLAVYLNAIADDEDAFRSDVKSVREARRSKTTRDLA